MSEFTEGILFLNKHLQEMQEAAKKFEDESFVRTFDQNGKNGMEIPMTKFDCTLRVEQNWSTSFIK